MIYSVTLCSNCTMYVTGAPMTTVHTRCRSLCLPLYAIVTPIKSYISSPLYSSLKMACTSCFLLILPMAFRGMLSTSFITWGIL